MLVEFLHKLLNRPALTVITLVLLFFVIAWSCLGVISVLSDAGFSKEITEYRWWIVLGAACAGVVSVLTYIYWYFWHQVSDLRSQVGALRSENRDLTEQKESALRLMERYRSEAQESIFKRLQDLALSGILAPVWKEKGAQVQRFRIERVTDTEGLHTKDSLDRVTVFINLNDKDGVMIGMPFFVQDPVDFKKYGTIVVKECHEQGSTCSIVDTEHTGFWTPVIKALQSPNDAEIINAMPNIITPTSPYQQLADNSAVELLDWLNKLEDVEL